MNKLDNVNLILKQYLFDTFNLNLFKINIITETNIILIDNENHLLDISNYLNEITIKYNDVMEKLEYKKDISSF